MVAGIVDVAEVEIMSFVFVLKSKTSGFYMEASLLFNLCRVVSSSEDASQI
jgi:hypothetical protein